MTFKYTPEQEAWLVDLETTTKPQTTGLLHRLIDEQTYSISAGYCCLGIACLTLGVDREIVIDEDGEELVAFDGSTEVAPEIVKKRLRLRSRDGRLLDAVDDMDRLTVMNDQGKSFKEIAAYIRANPENVFLPPEETSE